MIIPTVSLFQIFVRRWPDGTKATSAYAFPPRTTDAEKREALQLALRAVLDRAESHGIAAAELFDAVGAGV